MNELFPQHLQMALFIYSFGYETPLQFRNNNQFGWDDEDRRAVAIEAEDERSALEWGNQVAEAFLKKLFGDDSVSWSQRRYASWVEPPAEQFADGERIRVGEWPDLERWVASSMR